MSKSKESGALLLEILLAGNSYDYLNFNYISNLNNFRKRNFFSNAKKLFKKSNILSKIKLREFVFFSEMPKVLHLIKLFKNPKQIS